MASRRYVLPALAALALGLAGWILASGISPARGPDDGIAETEPSAPATEPRATVDARAPRPRGERATASPMAAASASESLSPPALARVVALALLDGEPAAGVSVRVERDGRWEERGTTGHDGRCAIVFAAEEAIRIEGVLASGGSHGETLVSPRARATADTREIVLELLRPARARIRTVWADGGAAPHAAVRVVGRAFRHDFGEAVLSETAWESDAAGELDLALHPSVAALELAAELPSGAVSGAARVSLAPGETRELELALRVPSTLSVRVLARDGAPVADATVCVPVADATVYVPVADATVYVVGEDGDVRRERTDATGRATIAPLSLGRLEVAAAASGTAGTAARSFTVTDVAEALVCELVLIEPESVEGRVTWPDGTPAAGVLVATRLEEQSEAERARDPLARRVSGAPRTTTAADGTFVLAPARPGLRYLVACAPDPTCRRCLVQRRGVPAGARDIELVLDPDVLRGAALRASVTAEAAATQEAAGPSAGGASAAVDPLYVTLYRRDGGGWIQDDSTLWLEESGGTFEIVGLEDGAEYALEVSGTGGTARLGPVVATRVGTELDVVLRPTRTVRVVGPSGLAYPRDAADRPVTVTATLVGADLPPRSSVVIRLDAEGRGRLVLAAGVYEVRATQGERASRPARVDVTAPGDAELALELAE